MYDKYVYYWLQIPSLIMTISDFCYHHYWSFWWLLDCSVYCKQDLYASILQVKTKIISGELEYFLDTVSNSHWNDSYKQHHVTISKQLW